MNNKLDPLASLFYTGFCANDCHISNGATLSISIICLLLGVIIAIFIVFTAIIVALIREKLNLKAELEHERASTELYDEIDPIRQVSMDMTENVAYHGASNN